MQTVKVTRKSFIKGIGAFIVGAFVLRRSVAALVSEDTVLTDHERHSKKLSNYIKKDSRTVARKENS